MSDEQNEIKADILPDPPEPNEPTDDEIGDGEENVVIEGQEAADLNEILEFFSNVLNAHEQAINLIAAAVFGGGQNESPVSEPSITDAANNSSAELPEGEGEVIPVDFGDSETPDAS